MTSWFGKGGAVRKSLSPAPKQGLLNSGSLEKSIGRGIGEMKLEGNVGGLYNPLAWESMPSSLREKFPHWKDSSRSFSQSVNKEDGLDDERAIYNLKSSKQPPCTIPYVVMDRDTIQGIAVKFETTPSEIARINKKPTLTFSIFPGDVLYVPDQDELVKLAPPTVLVEPPVISSISSASSETTPTITAIEDREGGEGQPEVEEEAVQTSPEPSQAMADEHISILSKYISEDQGCIHGNLIVNKSTLMFTPNNQDPLVKEHGVAKFEIIIPIGDIVYAAITHSVSPPRRRASTALFNLSEKTLTTVCEERSNQPLAEQDITVSGGEALSERGGGDKQTSTDGEIGVIDLSTDESKESQRNDIADELEVTEDAPLIKKSLKDMETSEGAPPSVVVSSPNDSAQVVELDESGAKPSREIQSSVSKSDEAESENDAEIMAPGQSDSADDMLAIMGAAHPVHAQAQHCSHSSESSESVTSLDALLADSPYFLHIYVSSKSLHAYTYTPINSSVGIDIPRPKSREDRDALIRDHIKKSKSLSPPVVHLVKCQFCFAVIDKRLDDLVEFISKQHPSSEPNLGPPCASESWTDNKYEFVNVGPVHSTEELSFEEDHFHNESWEVYSLNNVPLCCRIERMEVEHSLPPPTMSDSSDLLSDDHIKKLVPKLPSAAVSRGWYLIYSTFRHGISLRTLYRKMTNFENEDSPILLVIRDDQKKIFGAAVTCRIRISEKFYGSGESFLFMFNEEGELKVFPWTGLNNYVVKGNSDSFSIGSGDGHPGLWLDEYFYHGASYACSTFDNDCLASGQDFICSGVEAWGFL